MNIIIKPYTPHTLNKGETYVGRINDTYIFLLPGDIEANWKKATEWAIGIGGELPNRVESALLFATLKGEFEQDWYWTREQRASTSESESASAWVQGFSNGNQSSYHEGYTYRARAVRRLAVESFTPSAGA